MSIKNCLYVGVDVSLKSLTTCILDISGETVFKPKHFTNDPDGTAKLIFALLHDNRLYTLPKKGVLPIEN